MSGRTRARAHNPAKPAGRIPGASRIPLLKFRYLGTASVPPGTSMCTLSRPTCRPVEPLHSHFDLAVSRECLTEWGMQLKTASCSFQLRIPTGRGERRAPGPPPAPRLSSPHLTNLVQACVLLSHAPSSFTMHPYSSQAAIPLPPGMRWEEFVAAVCRCGGIRRPSFPRPGPPRRVLCKR